MKRWLTYKGICHVILLAICAFIRKTRFLSLQLLFQVSLKGGSLTQVSLYYWYSQYQPSWQIFCSSLFSLLSVPVQPGFASYHSFQFFVEPGYWFFWPTYFSWYIFVHELINGSLECSPGLFNWRDSHVCSIDYALGKTVHFVEYVIPFCLRKDKEFLSLLANVVGKSVCISHNHGMVANARHRCLRFYRDGLFVNTKQKGKRKVQEVPQSQTAALPRPQEEEETDKSKQAQIEQTYEKH